MEFKERIEKTFGDRLPKNPKFSVLTKRIILPDQLYLNVQKDYSFEEYNMWCAGVNKHMDPNSDSIIPVENYLETGDAERFRDLFIKESEAKLELEKAEHALDSKS